VAVLSFCLVMLCCYVLCLQVRYGTMRENVIAMEVCVGTFARCTEHSINTLRQH